MKKLFFISCLILILSGCISANNVQTVKPTPTITCPAEQYACACATGGYCLKMGEMCISPSSPCPVQSISYLVSVENPDKFCNGTDMDSEGFRKTITTEKTATIPDVNPTEIQQIKSIISLATTGMCQTALSQLDIGVNNGTVFIPPMDGWAGISIAMCSCKPEVEVNLLRIPGITEVVWQE
jgi:hypothetical protein